MGECLQPLRVVVNRQPKLLDSVQRSGYAEAESYLTGHSAAMFNKPNAMGRVG